MEKLDNETSGAAALRVQFEQEKEQDKDHARSDHPSPIALLPNAPTTEVDSDLYLTVGNLRHLTQGLPDSAKVFYQRIEDVYFEKHGWTTVEQPGDHGPDHFIRAFNAWQSDEDGGKLFITAHY